MMMLQRAAGRRAASLAAPGSPAIIEEPASPTMEEKLAMLETMLQQQLAEIFDELKTGAAEAEKNCECEMKKGEEKLEQMKTKAAQMKEKMDRMKEEMAAAPESVKLDLKLAALRADPAPASPE